MNAKAGAGSAAGPAQPVTPGAMLRAERERRGFSVQRAAEDLHLDAWLIEAIEADRFGALGAPVYAKGHLRKYAILLGLSPSLVLERYEALSGTPTEPMPIPAAIASPVPQRRRPRKWPWWVLAIVVVAALAWFGFQWWSGRRSEGAVSSVARPLPGPPPATGGGDQKVESGIPAPREGQGGGTPPQPTPAELRVRLEFSEPSWAEIYDATGKRLMFDMGAPGRTHTLVGVPPLRVTLGLAAAVSARVGERAIVIPRRAGRDATRFFIEADGSVRTDNSVKTAGREASE
jgi:cytoskeleton protein RodZ